MGLGAINLGTDSYVGVGATGQVVPGGTFAEIAGIFSGSLSISHDAVDTTNNDDAGFTSAKYGNTTVTLSLEYRFDPTDSAQGTLRTVASDLDGSCKVQKAFAVRPIVGTGEDSWSFEGIITSYEISYNNNEPVNVSIEVQSTGAVTYNVQT